MARIRKSIQAGQDAVILWESMASAIAAAYPQQRIFVVQPSVLDLLHCIRKVPDGKSCGVIIPLSLRDYYDDLELQLKAMEIPFYCLVSDTDERALQAAVHQAALSGIQCLVGSVGIGHYVRAEGMECIPLQPEWGGLVRAFFKVLWSLRQSRLSQKKGLSSSKGLTAYYHLDDIIGRSPMMKQVKSLARIYAASESTILITGESGTGKEMLAQAIHNMSSRRQGPFIAINCSAVSESLLESELFGYTGGSFTGAPPLRQRNADIAVVTQALLQRFNVQYGRHHELGQDVIDYFQTLPWPGNVRQLANTLERLSLVVSRKKITLPDLAWVMPNPPVIPDKSIRDRNLKDMTYEYIEKMYQEGKSVSEIAKELNISRSTIYRMRQKYQNKKRNL